jgi:hypothetical protein
VYFLLRLVGEAGGRWNGTFQRLVSKAEVLYLDCNYALPLHLLMGAHQSRAYFIQIQSILEPGCLLPLLCFLQNARIGDVRRPSATRTVCYKNVLTFQVRANPERQTFRAQAQCRSIDYPAARAFARKRPLMPERDHQLLTYAGSCRLAALQWSFVLCNNPWLERYKLIFSNIEIRADCFVPRKLTSAAKNGRGRRYHWAD